MTKLLCVRYKYNNFIDKMFEEKKKEEKKGVNVAAAAAAAGSCLFDS